MTLADMSRFWPEGRCPTCEAYGAHTEPPPRFDPTEECRMERTPDGEFMKFADHCARVRELCAALKRLTFAARTSGGTAGRDEELCAACDQAEAALTRAPAVVDAPTRHAGALAAPAVQDAPPPPRKPTEDMLRAGMEARDEYLRDNSSVRVMLSVAWQAMHEQWCDSRADAAPAVADAPPPGGEQ